MNVKALVCALLTVCLSQIVSADDHTSDSTSAEPLPFSIQVNVCSLKAGKSMKNYEKVFNAYLDWAKENDVDAFTVRQEPLFSHANSANPQGYDFLDMFVSPFSRWGKSWDLWLSTSEGQKLSAKWRETADCDVKLATGVALFMTPEMNSDDNRFVSWNWCSLNDGVEVEELMAAHASIAASITDEAPFIGWATLVPTVGGANAPGDFAHLAVYPDMESYMRMREFNAKGGWKNMRDYYALASCSGEAVNVETVLHRP